MSTVTGLDGVRALLADGRVVMIRADADAVLSLHMRLSERDRYLRFFGAGTRVLDAISRQITRAGDTTHAAVGAWLGERLRRSAGMVRGLRSSAALFGGEHPLPTEALVDILVRVGHLAESVAEVTELDLNPVVVRQVLDARVRLVPREPADPFLRRLRA